MAKNSQRTKLTKHTNSNRSKRVAKTSLARNRFPAKKVIKTRALKRETVQQDDHVALKTPVNIKYRIEELLFSSRRPLKQAQISKLLCVDSAIVGVALQDLQEEYLCHDSALSISENPSGWQFAICLPQARKEHLAKNDVSEMAEGNLQHSPPSSDTIAEQTDHHVVQSESDRTAYKEFLDELNEKVTAITHHNRNSSEDAIVREKLLSEIEGLMHTAPAVAGTDETHSDTIERRG